MWDSARIGFDEGHLRLAADGDPVALDRVCSGLAPLARMKVLAALSGAQGYLHAADDLTQEVLTGLMKGIPKLRTPVMAVLKHYLHRTVHQRVQQFWRDKGHQLPLADDLRHARPWLDDASTRTHLGEFASPDPTAGPVTRVDRAESLARVMLALGTLRAHHREAVELALLDQMETAEIGALLGITRNAAAMRLNRGLEELRRRLGVDGANEA